MNYISSNIDNEICVVKLNRPPVNALSFNLLKELKDCVFKINKNKKIRVLIISSNTEHFSAGADLKERKIMSLQDSEKALDNFNNCFNVIENFSGPVICAINGYCLGGGAELALACDIRIGSNDSIIGFPETSIGIIPGAGGTQRLPKIIGISNAKYWIYTAEKFKAIEALNFGFLNFVVKNNNLLDYCIKIAKKILLNAPIAVKSSKCAINDGYGTSLKEGLKIERDSYKIALNTSDRNEALNAFINKRKPKWKNK